MDFKKLEYLIGESLPDCVKKILCFCGFNTFSSLNKISVQNINEIEEYINKGTSGRDLIQSFDCCYNQTYKDQSQFSFLPGHRAVLLAIPDVAEKYQQQKFGKIPTYFPFILREMIQTAENNKDKFRPVYSEAIKSFSTYVFLKSGRSCYEFLSENLPLPSINLICKFMH